MGKPSRSTELAKDTLNETHKSNDLHQASLTADTNKNQSPLASQKPSAQKPHEADKLARKLNESFLSLKEPKKQSSFVYEPRGHDIPKKLQHITDQKRKRLVRPKKDGSLIKTGESPKRNPREFIRIGKVQKNLEEPLTED